MIKLPTKGVSRSVNEHNSKLDVLCDWVEGNALFDDEEFSTTDVVDILIEEQIYDDQDFASEMVESVWTEIRRRQRWLGSGTPFQIDHLSIQPQSTWQDAPGYSFCLLLAYAEWYRDWAGLFGADYTVQGELFELLTKESLELQFNDWQIFQTGWSRTHTVRLADVVDEVVDRLGEMKGDLTRWAEPGAKEAGLDLLCYRPFADKRVGIPVYLMQCASGRDWKNKLKTPDLDLWEKIIQFEARPCKAFSTPFALLDDVFIRKCNLVKGMLLDRYRVLAAARDNYNWVSQQLAERIVDWAEPRIASLPRVD